MRQTSFCRLALLIFACGGSAPLPADEIRFSTDATLRSIDFINPLEGWAVGDQGTAWMTRDGGVEWQIQPFETNATLTSVQFDPAGSVWVTSRESLPYTKGSIGNIYRRMGADPWLSAFSRPYAAGIHSLMIDGRGRGYAFGESSDAHPSGMQVTLNGGQSWMPTSTPITPGWTAVTAIDFNRVILARSHNGQGAIDIKTDTGVESYATRSTVRAMTMGGGRIWGVGDSGLVLSSSDSGSTWIEHELPVPKEVSAIWDFQAVATTGNSIWIVGRPGSVVLHSKDNGESWTLQKTGVPLPLYGLKFINENNGWAVGSAGTILVTFDGGETWSVQRSSDSRAAILWLMTDDREIPLDLVARLGGEAGYRNVAISIPQAGMQTSVTQSSEAWRFVEAFRSAGGLHTEVIRPGRPESGWQHSRAVSSAIRTWQPVLIVYSEQFQRSDDLLQANFAPEQISVLGLSSADSPAQAALSKDGAVAFDPREYSPVLDATYAEIATRASSRGNEPVTEFTEPVRLASLSSAPQGELGLPGLADLMPGAPGRRPTLAPRPEQEEREHELMRVSMDVWIADLPKTPREQYAWLVELTSKQSPSKSSLFLYRLARRLDEEGRSADAKSVYDFVITRYSNEPYAVLAYQWLVSRHASSEVFQSWHASGGGDGDVQAELTRHHRLCLAYAARLQEDNPLLMREPGLLLAFASASRYLGDALQTERYTTAIASPAWANFIPSPGDNPAPFGWQLAQKAPRPKLDGNFSDETWTSNHAIGAPLGTPTHPVEIKCAADRDYLYIAARCPIGPSIATGRASRAPLAKREGPDADMEGEDRLIVAIDVDGDYSSFYRFVVDDRGLVADDCVGDARWNPKWYVAVGGDEQNWTAEIAIPLAELKAPIEPSKPWGMRIARVSDRERGRAYPEMGSPGFVDAMPLRFKEGTAVRDEAIQGN